MSAERPTIGGFLKQVLNVDPKSGADVMLNAGSAAMVANAGRALLNHTDSFVNYVTPAAAANNVLTSLPAPLQNMGKVAAAGEVLRK